MSEKVETLNSNARKVTLHQLNSARLTLSAPVLQLKQLLATTSTAVKVVWEILSAEDYVEGIYLHYQKLVDNGSDREDGYRLVTVLNAGATSYTVTGLRKYSHYRFLLVPFFKTVEGRPSNSRVIQTLEDVPSSVPTHLEVGWLNETTAYARWGPPPLNELNGNLLGYKVQVRASGRVLVTMSVNASTSLVTLQNATPYVSVRVCALTRPGAGPYSPPAPIGPQFNPPAARPTDHGTSQALLVLTLAASVILCALTFLVSFYLKKRQALTKELGHCGNNIGDLSQMSLVNACKDPLWIEGGWVSLQAYQQPLASGANYSTPSLSTFYTARKENPTPYATTTLVNNEVSDSQIIPVRARTSLDLKTPSSSALWAKATEKKNTHCTTLPNNTIKSQMAIPRPPTFAARSTSQINQRRTSPTFHRRLSISSLVPARVVNTVTNNLSTQASNTNLTHQRQPASLIPVRYQHAQTTSSREQLDSFSNCSSLCRQPSHSATQMTQTSNQAAVTAPQCTELHIEPCGCNSNWDDSCSCSGSSCSYAQVNNARTALT